GASNHGQVRHRSRSDRAGPRMSDQAESPTPKPLSAAELRSAFAWDRRGIYLQNLEATWHASATIKAWQALTTPAAMELEPLEPGESIASASLTAISEPVG